MLEMRPGCEACDRDLPADEGNAYICSFECTFCTDCFEHFESICPNCGGPLIARPVRPTQLLGKYPASTKRIFKPSLRD